MEAQATSTSRGSIHKRKAHKKSKTGCEECRRRRVKCDEDRPKCRSCSRHGAICVYPRLPGAGSTASSPASTPASTAVPSRTPGNQVHVLRQSHGDLDVRSSPLLASPASDSNETFALVDLSLLHHWTLSTSRSLVNCPEIDRIWQVALPQIGFRYPFVMHALMSLAALHIAYLDTRSRRKHILDAIRHHNLSLQGFRETIDKLNDDNADALFACSTINFIYVFGVSGADEDDAYSAKRKSRLLGAEWIPMVRGVRAVLGAVMERVRVGPLGDLLYLDNWGDLDTERDPVPNDDRFRGMRTAWEKGDDAALYDETLATFRRCYLYVTRHSLSSDSGLKKAWAGPLIFLFMAPEEYFTRLHQRQPPALVLLCHFCAVLHDFRHFWFLDGWPRDIVEAADEILGDYWRPWTTWPREVVGLA